MSRTILLHRPSETATGFLAKYSSRSTGILQTAIPSPSPDDPPTSPTRSTTRPTVSLTVLPLTLFHLRPSMTYPQTTIRLHRPSDTATGFLMKHALRSTRAAPIDANAILIPDEDDEKLCLPSVIAGADAEDANEPTYKRTLLRHIGTTSTTDLHRGDKSEQNRGGRLPPQPAIDMPNGGIRVNGIKNDGLKAKDLQANGLQRGIGLHSNVLSANGIQAYMPHHLSPPHPMPIPVPQHSPPTASTAQSGT
ncbi:hypothetical protein HYPSUDRAFT_199155 [Hypholoma sublateritium FD-334 SS-4]|uniref:Uncharacterized protein n=1 Tax=Hypholoma sublateritium (strain FD-334 SS-4) TaxID=945553 RepID=A0A0D2PCY0_HYPSF|nr:hypothetical protein HYPSUDRAFT_199155 [Hypholoma sublateritium FD-334 SS-4]